MRSGSIWYEVSHIWDSVNVNLELFSKQVKCGIKNKIGLSGCKEWGKCLNKFVMYS